jgi:hypothetical protein
MNQKGKMGTAGEAAPILGFFVAVGVVVLLFAAAYGIGLIYDHCGALPTGEGMPNVAMRFASGIGTILAALTAVRALAFCCLWARPIGNFILNRRDEAKN